MSNFLVIPRIKIEHANAMQSWWLMSIPSPITCYGFAIALGMNLKEYKINPQRIAITYHQANFLVREKFSARYVRKPLDGNQSKKWDVMFSNRKILPQQQQGSTLIDEQDHIAGSFTKSLQPSSRCHVTLSIVIELNDEDIISLEEINNFLWSARLGGGSIVSHNPISLCLSSEEVSKKIGGGFWIKDESSKVKEILSEKMDGTEAIIKILAKNQQEKILYRKLSKEDKEKTTKPESWLSVNTIGYAALEELKKRTGIRINDKTGEAFLHAYAEPIIGLISYKPVRSLKTIPFWEYQHDHENGIYFMKGE